MDLPVFGGDCWPFRTLRSRRTEWYKCWGRGSRRISNEVEICSLCTCRFRRRGAISRNRVGDAGCSAGTISNSKRRDRCFGLRPSRLRANSSSLSSRRCCCQEAVRPALLPPLLRSPAFPITKRKAVAGSDPSDGSLRYTLAGDTRAAIALRIPRPG
jgi:hypothetical protein